MDTKTKAIYITEERFKEGLYKQALEMIDGMKANGLSSHGSLMARTLITAYILGLIGYFFGEGGNEYEEIDE